VFSGGLFSGRLTDAGFFNVIFLLGVLLQVIGIFATSFATQFYQVPLGQGVCAGIGSGFIFCPALTVMSQYFKNRRGLATAIAVSGSATGGIIFPAIANSTLRSIGYGWTIHILGFITLATHIPCLLWLRPRLPPRKTGPLVELSALKEVPFAFFNLAMFFNFLSLYFTFFYLGTFARNILEASPSVSTNLLMILNGVGIIGRLFPSFLADKYLGLVNTMIPVNILISTIMYSWAGVHSISGLYVFAVIYGFFAAGMQGMFPAVLGSLTLKSTQIGTRMGMTFAVVGFSSLIGLPILGLLITALPGGQFLYAQITSGTFLLVGSLFMIVARVALTGLTLTKKV